MRLRRGSGGRGAGIPGPGDSRRAAAAGPKPRGEWRPGAPNCPNSGQLTMCTASSSDSSLSWRSRSLSWRSAAFSSSSSWMCRRW